MQYEITEKVRTEEQLKMSELPNFPIFTVALIEDRLGLKNFQTVTMKRCFVILIIMLYASNIIAQGNGTVTGIILDAETGNPMEAVNVSADRRSGTISDTEGKFSLSLTSGRHLLEFYFVGYEISRKTIFINENDTTRLTITNAGKFKDAGRSGGK
jgi:hypothetical protein